MAVLITSKFDEDPIKTERASLETHFSIISLWEIFRRSRAANSIVSGPIWPKVKLFWDFKHVLVTCKYKKNRIKNNREKMRHHNMSIENLIRPQGHVTPKWLIRSSRNSNSSEILWLSWLQASLTKIRSKMNELAWRHHFPIISLWEIFRRSRAANSIVSGPIWPKLKLLQDFMHVLVTCKYKKNRIKNNKEKVETSFSQL